MAGEVSIGRVTSVSGRQAPGIAMTTGDRVRVPCSDSLLAKELIWGYWMGTTREPVGTQGEQGSEGLAGLKFPNGPRGAQLQWSLY